MQQFYQFEEIIETKYLGLFDLVIIDNTEDHILVAEICRSDAKTEEPHQFIPVVAMNTDTQVTAAVEGG